MQINFLHDYIDPTKGGIENTVYYLYKEMSKKHEVHALSKPVDLKYKLNGIDYLNREYGKNLFKLIHFFWLLEHSGKNAVNIAMNWCSASSCIIANILFGTKYIVLAHGNEVYFENEEKSFIKKLKRIRKQYHIKKIFKRASYVACNSKYTESLVKKIWSNCNTKIIHPGINYKEYDIGRSTRNGIVLLSIGRLVERKGFCNVIEAVRSLRKSHNNLNYYIIGDGPLFKFIDDKIKLYNMEEFIHLLGKVDEDIKMEYINKCDCLVMPSTEIPSDASVEGFGIVYVEANMAGKYVIGSNTGGVSDAIPNEKCGFMLPATDSESIINAINWVIDNFENIYTTENIEFRKQWAEKHSFENIAKCYEEILR